MADLHGFDANEQEPAKDFEAIPAGKYEVVITDSEMKPTKAGTGEMLKLTLQVVSGPHKNRFIWTNLNLRNPNATAEQIARGQLAAICLAVGIPQPKDSEELHDKPLIARVSVREYQGDKQNEVKGFSSRGDAEPPAAADVPPTKPGMWGT